MNAKMMLGIFAAVLGLSGCEQLPKDQLVVVRGQTYSIPWQDRPVISSVGTEIYVRASRKLEKNMKIEMLYDPREYIINVKLGAPNLLGVIGNDEREISKQLKRFKVEGKTVFCHERLFGKHVHFTCGFRVQDGNVSWAVIFDENRIYAVPAIRVEAQRLLQLYRKRANFD